MAQNSELNKYISKSVFKNIESSFFKNFHLNLETTDANGKELKPLCSKGCHPEFCKLVRSSPTGFKRCLQDRLRSLNIATETGQPYISLCHAGIVLVCEPIMNGDKPLGGLFFGKCLWEKPSQIVIDDIFKRLKGIKISKTRLLDAIKGLKVFEARKIHEASEFLYILMYQSTHLDPRVVAWRRERTLQQSHIGEFIHEKKQTGLDELYPFESERKLVGKVRIGDRTGAREILNSIIGTIIFHNPGNLNILKARLLELLTMISRSVVEGGVDIDILLQRNLEYINKITLIDNQEDLSAWILNALDEFIELVYSLQNSKKVTQLNPVIDYLERNYQKQITLSEIAKIAHLSISRLSHIFKEQTGMTVIDYLTHLRIEKTKKLLLTTDKNCTEVCFEVGFNNQSYFTRLFKKIESMTPKQFRNENRRNISG